MAAKKSNNTRNIESDNLPTVQPPVADGLVYLLPWGIGREYVRTVNDDKAFKRIEKRLRKRAEDGHCKIWKDAGTRYRINCRVTLPGGVKVLVQFGAKDPMTQRGGLRVDMNPAKLEAGDVEYLHKFVRKVIGETPESYDALLARARINQLDLAVDVVNVQIEDLLIDYKGSHEVSMIVKRLKKGKIETMNFGSVTSDYINAVYNKREEVIHCAIEKLMEKGSTGNDGFKGNLIRRVKDAHGMPATMRVEIRGKKMGVSIRDLADCGTDRFERFKFYDIAGLDALDNFTRITFLALARDLGLRAAVKHFKGSEHYRAVEKAALQPVAWWRPEGLWKEGVRALKKSGIFPAEAFKKPKSRG